MTGPRFIDITDAARRESPIGVRSGEQVSIGFAARPDIANDSAAQRWLNAVSLTVTSYPTTDRRSVGVADLTATLEVLRSNSPNIRILR